MTLAGLLTYGGALAIAAAIPGPGITAVVARALGSGLRSSIFMSLGLVCGDLVYLTAVVLGLAFVAQTFGLAFMIIKYLGIAYLAYLAWSFWRSGISAETINAKRSQEGPLASYLSGLILTLGNPKTMIFYVALTPTLVDLANTTLADYAMLALITAIVLILVLLPYLLLATRARLLLQTPRALKILNRTAAIFMGGAALAIASR